VKIKGSGSEKEDCKKGTEVRQTRVSPRQSFKRGGGVNSTSKKGSDNSLERDEKKGENLQKHTAEEEESAAGSTRGRSKRATHFYTEKVGS